MLILSRSLCSELVNYTRTLNMFVVLANPTEMLLALIFSWQAGVPLVGGRKRYRCFRRYVTKSPVSVFVRACREVRSAPHIMWSERSKEAEEEEGARAQASNLFNTFKGEKD